MPQIEQGAAGWEAQMLALSYEASFLCEIRWALSSSINISWQERKTLPAMTVCAWPAFKERGFYFTTDKYENMTFDLGYFLNVSILNKPNIDIKYVNVTETRTSNFGKCFTLKVTKSLRVNEAFILVFKRSWDLKVFVHNDGEEFWLAWSPYGSLVNNFRLNIKSDTEAAMTYLKVAEKQVEYFNTNTRPCNESNSGRTREAILRDAAYHRSFKTNHRSLNLASLIPVQNILFNSCSVTNSW